MTAPALILLAQGSVDHSINTTMHALRKKLQIMRPNLSINLAFQDNCPPTGPQVVSALAKKDVQEVVFVPVSLTRAIDAGEGVQEMLRKVQANHPQLKCGLARPIGPAVELLNILDERLRGALRQARALELDGLVLATRGDADIRGNALLARRARQWSAHHNLAVSLAANDATGPSTASAIAGLRSQGRRHIAVGSLYLSADENYLIQHTAALQAGAIAVSSPFGADERVLEQVLARYAFAAMELLEMESADERAAAL